jgi:type IV pilus assembly protein PilM
VSSNIVGVDIGSDHIRAVELKGANTPKPVVVRYGEIAISPGAVRRGEVLDVPAVSAAIRRLWSQARIGSKQVVLGMGGPRVMARDLAVPAVPLEYIRESLPFQVQDTLPMPVSDAILDFYPISEEQTEQGDMINGLLVAAVRDAVVANVDAVTRAGLTVVNVDLIPFALVRALGAGNSTGSVLYVSVGARTTNLVVTQNRVPQLVRILPIGGDDIDTALINRFSFTPEQARSAKFSYGIATQGVAPEQQLVVSTIVKTVSDLLASIRDTASYFINLHPNAALRTVVVSGGGTRLPGFMEALQEMSGLETVQGTTSAAARYPKKSLKSLSAEARDDLTLALGLAVGSGV